jgi:hypothetical protein
VNVSAATTTSRTIGQIAGWSPAVASRILGVMPHMMGRADRSAPRTSRHDTRSYRRVCTVARPVTAHNRQHLAVELAERRIAHGPQRTVAVFRAAVRDNVVGNLSEVRPDRFGAVSD